MLLFTLIHWGSLYLCKSTVIKELNNMSFVRIKILRRCGERGRVRTHSGAYRRTMVSWKTSKLHILQPKSKFNMELNYHGQSIVDIQKNTPTNFLRFYLILFYFNNHFIHFFLHHQNTWHIVHSQITMFFPMISYCLIGPRLVSSV